MIEVDFVSQAVMVVELHLTTVRISAIFFPAPAAR